MIAFTLKNAITPLLKPTEAVHLTAPISVVLYAHPTCDASLQETNLEHWQSFIDAAIAECALSLVRHPALAPMYGKPRNMRRSVGFFAKCEDTYGYFFSGQFMKTISIGTNTQHLLDLVNTTFDTHSNAVLVNRYDDGTEYISDHQDNEGPLVVEAEGIVAISVGASRIFRIREIDEHGKHSKSVCDATTKSHHALIMKGVDFQRVCTHGIPPTTKVHTQRISFTFRKHDKTKEEALYQKFHSRKRKIGQESLYISE